MVEYEPWEISTETTGGQADSAAVLAEAVDVADFPAAGTGATDKCLMLLAVTAERRARYPSGLQTASRFIAAIVLRKWVMVVEAIREGSTTGPVHPKGKADRI